MEDHIQGSSGCNEDDFENILGIFQNICLLTYGLLE